MHHPDDSIPALDPMELVTEYRSTLSRLAKASSDQQRNQLETAAQFLRTTWKNLKGKDSLHDIAFGTPEDK